MNFLLFIYLFNFSNYVQVRPTYVEEHYDFLQSGNQQLLQQNQLSFYYAFLITRSIYFYLLVVNWIWCES